MIINEKLNSLYNSNNRDLNAYILINGAKKVSSTDLLKDFKLNQKIDIDGIWIGQAIPKLLELTIIKRGLNYTLERNQKLEIFHGIKDELEVFQYSKLGTFYIREIEDKEDSETIKLICYDDLKKLQDIDIPTITYPLSVNNLLKKVMGNTGILYDTTNLINLNFNISKEIYFGNKPKVIDVIRAIAQANLCYAYIDTITNKLKFGRLKNVNTQISDDVTFRLKVKDMQKPYNSVVIARTPQEDNVYNRLPGSNEDNLVELKIENNPILDLDRENFATSLLNVAKTITYEGAEDFVILSNPLIEVGDIVTIRNHNIAILEQTITLTRNAINSVIAKKTSTDYMKAKSLEKLQKDTELYVDKVKGEIVARVSDEVENKVVELKLDENGITQRVKSKVEEKLSDPKTQDKFKGKDGTGFTWNIYKGGAILDKSRWVKYDANGLTINGEEIFFHTAKQETSVMGYYRLNDYNDILEQGKTYTVSFDAKNLRDDALVRFTVNGFSSFSYVTLERSEEKRVVITGVRDTARPMQLQAGNTVLGVNLRFEMKNLKIEEGAVTNTIFTPHPDEVKPDYTEFRTEFSTEINQLSNQISSKVEKKTYNYDLGTIRVDVASLTHEIGGLTLTMQTKGKYRNTLMGSDNFENYNLNTSNYYEPREDGSMIFGFKSSSSSSEAYFLFPLDRLEYLNNGDKATLLVDRLYASEGINKIVFSLADKDKNIVSNAFIYSDNSKIYEFTLTGKPEYLRVAMERSDTTSVGVRFYKETIAVVAGSVDNLTWDMSYINDSVTQYKFLKDEFSLSLGDLKTELKGDINGLTLSGSKITLTGDTNVNGSFKISANNLSEIGGFKITNSVLEGGSGSSYIRLSGNPDYVSILVGGETWGSAKFAVSSTGTLKAEGANISGTITANSGSIGNWNIDSNGIYRSGNGYYVHIKPTNAYPIFFGTDSNNSRFRVSQTGNVLARAFTLEGGKVGGTDVYSSYMSGGSWSSANGSGSFSGSASFSSGSYTGSGYLSSGVLGGSSFSSSNDRLNIRAVNADILNVDTLSINSSRFSIKNSSGVGVFVSLNSNGFVTSNSDIRLKENIKELTDEYNKYIYDLPLIKYNYKSDEKHRPQVGVNANLLMKILPEEMAKSFLHQDEETGLYGAKYELLIPYTIKAIQDLNKRLERLENE